MLGHRRPVIPALAALIVLAAAAPAAHAVPTRAEYVALVDPVCQLGQQRMKAQAKRQRPRVKEIAAKLEQQADNLSEKRVVALQGEFTRRVFSPTLRVFPQVTAGIAAVAPAPGDDSAVAGWLGSRRTYLQLIDRAVRAAQRGQTQKQNRLIENATAKLIEGELPVEGFGFRYCLLSSPQD
jgi:hypothetical protein